MNKLMWILLWIAGVASVIMLFDQVDKYQSIPIQVEIVQQRPQIKIIQTGETDTHYYGINYYVDYMIDLKSDTRSFDSPELRDLFIQWLGEVGEVSELWK